MLISSPGVVQGVPDRSVSAALRFQCDRVGGERAWLQCDGQTGDDRVVGHVAVQEQRLDQCPGAGGVAVGLADRGPSGVMHCGELPAARGLFECGRAGQGTGFADHGVHFVVPLEARTALGE